MDPETQRRVEETVMEILNQSDMEETTEFRVRTMASEKLEIDLSKPVWKKFVRRIVESFLISRNKGQEEEQEEEEEEEKENEKGDDSWELDEEGDPIICRLSNKRRVTVQDFRGKTLVSIREYYDKDGKQFPSSKGISLSAEQWASFRKSVPAIEDAIKKMKAGLE